MKATILLSHNENTKKIEDEEKTRYLLGILEQMELPVQDHLSVEEDGVLSIDQRIKLRGLLRSYGVQVIDNLDGQMCVYVEGEKVASFEKPTYKLKRDYSQLDPRKQLYLEMTIECNSVFEENE
jgi:hypothetical protein